MLIFDVLLLSFGEFLVDQTQRGVVGMSWLQAGISYYQSLQLTTILSRCDMCFTSMSSVPHHGHGEQNYVHIPGGTATFVVPEQRPYAR